MMMSPSYDVPAYLETEMARNNKAAKSTKSARTSHGSYVVATSSKKSDKARVAAMVQSPLAVCER